MVRGSTRGEGGDVARGELLVGVGVRVVTVSGGSDVLGVVGAGRVVVAEGRVAVGAGVDGAVRPVVVALSTPCTIATVPITARPSTMPGGAATHRQRLESS